MADLNKLAKAASEVNGGIGVYAIASTLGSLEALLEFLKTSKHPRLRRQHRAHPQEAT